MFPNSTWLSNGTGYAPTEISQLNLVTKEIQELQETQTLFCVTEDFFFGCLQKERRSHKEHKQYKEQAVISTHSSTSFEDLHKQIDQHKASFYPFSLWHLYFSQDSIDLVIMFKLREPTLYVLPEYCGIWRSLPVQVSGRWPQIWSYCLWHVHQTQQ